jgi:dTMP kinase
VAERGRLIAFEGVDGCGKSTQARAFASALGSAATLTREPGATALGARVRALVLDAELPALSVRTEALLLAADRAEHVAEVVRPLLDEGCWVVTDRFSGSTLAYQGYGRGLDVGELTQLVTWAAGGIEADLNVLVDLPLAVARGRARRRDGAGDRLEQLDEDFHERVRSGYLSLATAHAAHWAVVDGEGEVDEVAARVLSAVTARLGPLPGRPSAESR